MSDEKTLSLDTYLAARTAEMLALPLILCSHRDCRRGPSCQNYYPENGEPCCLGKLQGEERTDFDALFSKVLAVWRHALNWHALDFASPMSAERDLEDAAVEIVGLSLPASERPRFNHWQRKREKFKAANPAVTRSGQILVANAG